MFDSWWHHNRFGNFSEPIEIQSFQWVFFYTPIRKFQPIRVSGNVPFGGFFRVPLKNHRLHYISLIYNNLRQSFLGAKTYFCIPA